jgi:spore photoproduct lyase
MVRRAASLGAEIVRLRSDRLTGLPGAYRDAKRTLAVVTASPSRRRLQPIPPSADWRFDLAEGCPAHCAYCYLAGSLSGPPVIRAYANLPEILAALPAAVGHGAVTSVSPARAREGTTFECSCYTDPLAIEHLTGHLAACITRFGAWDAPVQLRFTTKFDAVGPLLDLPHNGRTRVRFSVNAREAERHEGGAPRIRQRLAALRAMAMAGYPVGLTVAPILRLPDWPQAYDRLFAGVADTLKDVAGVDLTIELITHRFTPRSKDVLAAWYPGSSLDMDEARRSRKTSKFGAVKYVFPREQMSAMRASIEASIESRLPAARILYWT